MRCRPTALLAKVSTEILQVLSASWSWRVRSWLRRFGNGSNQFKLNHETVHQIGLQIVGRCYIVYERIRLFNDRYSRMEAGTVGLDR
jgi:hypothetical protein